MMTRSSFVGLVVLLELSTITGCPAEVSPSPSLAVTPPAARTASAEPAAASSNTPEHRAPRAPRSLDAASVGLDSPLLLDARRVPRHEDMLAKVAERRGGTVQKYLARFEGVLVLMFRYESDGLMVHGYVAAPAEGADRLPCIIYNRGGSRDLGAITHTWANLRLGHMAQWGYVVIASQYRGAAGGEGADEFGGADVADVLNLLPVLESIPRADTSRIGMFGASRGGMMTMLALTRTDRIAAAVIHAGPSDQFDVVQRRPRMEHGVFAELIPNYWANRDEALLARSPARWADRLDPDVPILLLHGTGDWRVHPSQALKMADALQQIDHPYRLVMYEGGDHGLTEHREDVERNQRQWFHRYVRDGEEVPRPPPPPAANSGAIAPVAKDGASSDPDPSNSKR